MNTRIKTWFSRGKKFPYSVATISAQGTPENVWDFRTEFERQNFIREKLTDEPETKTFTFWNK